MTENFEKQLTHNTQTRIFQPLVYLSTSEPAEGSVNDQN